MTDMAVSTSGPLRAQLADVLGWESAHTGVDTAVTHMPFELQGVRPAGLDHSAWELLEHIRLGQYDILEFCRNHEYVELKWPDDYWPPSAEPPSETAWAESIAALQRDRAEFQRLLADPGIELLAPVPAASDPAHTYLRAALLAADHAAYHTGQLMLVRRLLGAMPA